MRIFPRLTSTLFASGMAALLLGNLALPDSAQAALEYSSDNPSYNDKFLIFHNSFGKDVMVRSNFSVDDVEKLANSSQSNTTEIDRLKKTVSEQTRVIEELKRNSGSSSSSSASEISSLKRTVEEQDRNLKKLTSQVEDLKRSAGSSSSSSSSELSSLKRDVSAQNSQLDQLKRTVEDLSRKVK